ncbi:MAG: hypothetical protein K0S68_602 [Candidatus Saccharibacteria bacterium]|jgi:hypothetical protein|nr:hypothetical protein [Candidatus Saccharibacteria bacterium]
MEQHTYNFPAEIWLYDGPAAWHFITLPEPVADDIQQRFGHLKRGWGSLRVALEINGVEWETSIFTDKPRRSFLLPLKADKRRQASVTAGDMVEVTLTVLP